MEVVIELCSEDMTIQLSELCVPVSVAGRVIKLLITDYFNYFR